MSTYVWLWKDCRFVPVVDVMVACLFLPAYFVTLTSLVPQTLFSKSVHIPVLTRTYFQKLIYDDKMCIALI